MLYGCHESKVRRQSPHRRILLRAPGRAELALLSYETTSKSVKVTKKKSSAQFYSTVLTAATRVSAVGTERLSVSSEFGVITFVCLKVLALCCIIKNRLQFEGQTEYSASQRLMQQH